MSPHFFSNCLDKILLMIKLTEESHEENFLQITSLGVEKGFSKFEGKLALYVAFTVTSFVCQMPRFLPNYLDTHLGPLR